MTKFEECLEELDAEINDYIKSVGEFQLREEGDKWIFDHYEEDEKVKTTCQLCGHYPLRHLYFIRNVETNQKMILGNRCIERYANIKIKEWFQSWQKRRKQLIENKKLIFVVQGFIERYENKTLPIKMSRKGYERLKKMLEALCRGWKPRESQMRLLRSYARKLP